MLPKSLQPLVKCSACSSPQLWIDLAFWVGSRWWLRLLACIAASLIISVCLVATLVSGALHGVFLCRPLTRFVLGWRKHCRGTHHLLNGLHGLLRISCLAN